MLRIWRNLRMNLRAWPRMGASLLLAEKLTKLPLAELGFCFVMLYPFHSTCAFPEPGIEPGTCDFRVRRASHSAAIRRPGETQYHQPFSVLRSWPFHEP